MSHMHRRGRKSGRPINLPPRAVALVAVSLALLAGSAALYLTKLPSLMAPLPLTEQKTEPETRGNGAGDEVPADQEGPTLEETDEGEASESEAEKEDEAQRVLNSQQVLEPEELSILHRAVGEVFTRPQRCAKPEEFNQLYFSADEKSAARAYEKGHISARDYCLLQAVCHSRQAGQDDANTRLLCNGIARWGKQKELPEKDVQEITYAVLSSAAGTEEPSSAWKRVKALFDL